jgi:epoxyqueuosine reductase
VPPLAELSELIHSAARDAGFDLAGISPVADFRELAYFPEWIAAGRAGDMKYLEARDDFGSLKRASLSATAPWARSVVVCAVNYNTAQPYSTQVNNPDRGWISRYAWSREDYHDAVMRRLREVETKLREAFMTSAAKAAQSSTEMAALKGCATQNLSALQDVNATGSLNTSLEERRFSAAEIEGLQPRPPELITRCYVDTGPLVERVYAKYAGLGWIGKNTCIINQKKGSWLFLGVILTSLELTPDLPAPDRCGTCTRCIQACPTDAIIAPYQLDSNLCIAYLTIEKRGEIPEHMRAGLGRHVFGCDICQDVCPWNRKAAVTPVPEFAPREGLVNPALAWLAEMSAEEFNRTFSGSPIRRTKRVGLRRNAILAMGNSGQREFVPLLKRLTGDDDAVVAESAEWALRQLEEPAGLQEKPDPGHVAPAFPSNAKRDA